MADPITRLNAVVGAERFLAEIKTTANLQHPHITFRAEDAGGEGAGLMLEWERTRVPIPISVAGS